VKPGLYERFRRSVSKRLEQKAEVATHQIGDDADCGAADKPIPQVGDMGMIRHLQRFDFAPHASRESIIIASLQPDLLHAYKKTSGLVQHEQRHTKRALPDFPHDFVIVLSGFIRRERKRAHTTINLMNSTRHLRAFEAAVQPPAARDGSVCRRGAREIEKGKGGGGRQGQEWRPWWPDNSLLKCCCVLITGKGLNEE
jgi:hypothetical protein